MVMRSKAIQDLKAQLSMVSMADGIFNVVSASHSAKAYSPIDVTLSDIVTVLKDLQL